MADLYDAAVKRMPICLGGYDPLYHKTVADILFMVETELSLYEEGEPETDIKTKQQLRSVKKYIESLKSDCEVK